MIDAGLVYKVNKCSKPELPLKFYEDFSAFKLYLSDCGLMGAMADTDTRSVLLGDRIFTEYKGAFTEQYVLQQMVSAGNRDIYYYSAEDSRMKIDFLIQKQGVLMPIEVKAGTSIKATSFHNYLMRHQGLHAIRFSMLPYKKQDYFTNVPLYSAFLLKP